MVHLKWPRLAVLIVANAGLVMSAEQPRVVKPVYSNNRQLQQDNYTFVAVNQSLHLSAASLEKAVGKFLANFGKKCTMRQA